MKQILSYLLLSFFLHASCQQEVTIASSGKGTLSLSSVEVTGTEVIPVSTRAVNPVLAIEIAKADGTPVVKYAAGASEASQKIELEAGDYLLKAYSANYGATWENAEKGEPVYYKEQSFSIEAERVRYLTVAVPMVNMGVTFALPEGFGTWFKSYTFSAQIGERSVALQNGETAYFDLPSDGNNILNYSLTVVNTDDESQNKNSAYPGITTGSLYEITYLLATQSLEVR